MEQRDNQATVRSQGTQPSDEKAQELQHLWLWLHLEPQNQPNSACHLFKLKGLGPRNETFELDQLKQPEAPEEIPEDHHWRLKGESCNKPTQLNFLFTKINHSFTVAHKSSRTPKYKIVFFRKK